MPANILGLVAAAWKPSAAKLYVLKKEKAKISVSKER